MFILHHLFALSDRFSRLKRMIAGEECRGLLQACLLQQVVGLDGLPFVNCNRHVRAQVLNCLNALVWEADGRHDLVGHDYQGLDVDIDLGSFLESLVNLAVLSFVFVPVQIETCEVEIRGKLPAVFLHLAGIYQLEETVARVLQVNVFSSVLIEQQIHSL